MTQGVPIESQERQEICRDIVDAMCAGTGVTLTAAIHKVTEGGRRVSEREVYRWKAEDEAFSQAIALARDFGEEKVLDLAESRVVRIIHNYKLKAHDKMLRYYLDRKGGRRGYTPRHELKTPPGFPLGAAIKQEERATEEEALGAFTDLLRRE